MEQKEKTKLEPYCFTHKNKARLPCFLNSTCQLGYTYEALGTWAKWLSVSIRKGELSSFDVIALLEKVAGEDKK